jgi:hypothetical protein
MNKPVVGRNYNHNPNHFKFARTIEHHYDMITDVTPPKSNRTVVLLGVLFALVLILVLS